jgi:hypothetical protein
VSFLSSHAKNNENNMQKYGKFGHGKFSRYAVNPVNRLSRPVAQKQILCNSRLQPKKHRSSKVQVSPKKGGIIFAVAAFEHIQTAFAVLRYMPLHIKRFLYRMLGFQHSEQRDSDAKKRALISRISRVRASNLPIGKHKPRRKIIPQHSRSASPVVGIAKFFAFLLSFSYWIAAVRADETAAVAVSCNTRRRDAEPQAYNNTSNSTSSTSVSEYRRFSIFNNNSSALCQSSINATISNTSVQQDDQTSLFAHDFARNNRGCSINKPPLTREEREKRVLDRLITSCADAIVNDIKNNDTKQFLRFNSIKGEVIERTWPGSRLIDNDLRLNKSDEVSTNCTLELLKRDKPSAALRFVTSGFISDRIFNDEYRLVFWEKEAKDICDIVIYKFKGINEKTAANKLQTYCSERFPSKVWQLISACAKPIMISLGIGFSIKCLSLCVKMCVEPNLIVKLNFSTDKCTKNKWNYKKERNRFELFVDAESLKSGLKSARIVINNIASYYLSKGMERVYVDRGNSKVTIERTDENIEIIKSLPREAVNCATPGPPRKKNQISITNYSIANTNNNGASSFSSSSSSIETNPKISAKKCDAQTPTIPRLGAEQWKRVIENCKNDPKVQERIPENFRGLCNIIGKK